jgi:hypothetical protein
LRDNPNAELPTFTPPVPFSADETSVVSDSKYFLNNEEWLDLWARRFEGAAVAALADVLRRLPWRAEHERSLVARPDRTDSADM